ncbi:MAG: serine/threonine-protein kinase [Bryobacteraceae bacterium]|nr:serine/threonine-protein kinase [Bryobacteraceae bacterium]
MSPEPRPADRRWLRVQDLFHQAEPWPPDERSSRLASIEPDAGIVAEVLELLAAADVESAAARRITAKRAPSLPPSVGPYRVLRLAGHGGRGRVFQAVRETAGAEQVVAVKVMLDHLIAPADLARFEREQRILLSLNHPGISRFLDAGWDDTGRPYTAMEWIEGESIDAYCARANPTPAQRIRLLIEVLDALDAAHRSLIAHLDLKPSNILVEKESRVRLLDFGAAKLLAVDDPTSTQQLTPRYSSPERLRAEPVTTACDIYSAGLILHELLTGRGPFVDSTSIVALGERASGAATLSIATGAADLDLILQKALDFDPARRYASAAAFAADLQAYLEKRPVAARRPTPWYRLARFADRHRPSVALGALGLCALAALAAYALFQQHQRNREAERTRHVASFLRGMLTMSAVPGSATPGLTVAEMVARAHRRLKAGAVLPDDLAAGIQADFAYLTQEHGREDLAEPMARDALSAAERSGDPAARLQARSALATVLMRTARCPEAVRLFATGDPLLAPALPPSLLVSYRLARASAAEQCEARLNDAISWTEAALNDAAALPNDGYGIPPAVMRAAIHLQETLLLSRAGRPAEALHHAGQGLALAASHPDGAYFRVALLRIRSQAHTAAANPTAALADIREAARLAPGIVNPFEEVRLQTLTAGRLADTGDLAAAAAHVRSAVAAARPRAAAIGPSFWMILADAAEVLARTHACDESQAHYREVDALTQGNMPRTWRGNRLFYEAECALPMDPRRAAQLARQALDAYGDLLPATHKRRARLGEILSQRQ